MLKKAMLLGLLVLPLSLPAKAQNICTARNEVLGHLDNKYSEAPVAMGLANNGGVIEVLSSGTGTGLARHQWEIWGQYNISADAFR